MYRPLYSVNGYYSDFADDILSSKSPYAPYSTALTSYYGSTKPFVNIEELDSTNNVISKINYSYRSSSMDVVPASRPLNTSLYSSYPYYGSYGMGSSGYLPSYRYGFGNWFNRRRAYYPSYSDMPYYMSQLIPYYYHLRPVYNNYYSPHYHYSQPTTTTTVTTRRYCIPSPCYDTYNYNTRRSIYY